MGRGLLLLMLTVLLAGAGPACAQDPAGRFDGWATAVIAADWRDGGGQPIAAFDNARRDVARGLIDAGLRGAQGGGGGHRPAVRAAAVRRGGDAAAAADAAVRETVGVRSRSGIGAGASPYGNVW